MDSANHQRGITLNQAGLIAGIGLLVATIVAPLAEFYIYPKFVIPGKIEQTVQNILANQSLFIAGILCYMLTFIADIVIAWSLYILLKQVNYPLSLLTAWFRLIYAVISLVALLNLVNVLRLINTADYVAYFGTDQFHTQVKLLLNSFRYEWGISFILFGTHLGLLGYLVYKSGFIPAMLGILLAIGGLGYMVDSLSPYLFPGADMGYLMITFFGELIFMFWLLIKSSKIQG